MSSTVHMEGVGVAMIDPEQKLVCRLDGLTVSAREQQRLFALAEMNLLEAESIPVFEEAAQTAAHFLDAPICILGLMDQDRQWFKAAVGLSRLGLMNELAASRQLLRSEAFCTHVVDSRQVLAISDTLTNPVFANSLLTQQYGIRSYLGVPLLTSAGHCLGTLAVMDLVPRTFTDKQIDFLELTARWSISEFERSYLIKTQRANTNWNATLPRLYEQAASVTADRSRDVGFSGEGFSDGPAALFSDPHASYHDSRSVARLDAPYPGTHSSVNSVRIELLTQLTQELRTPLTSVMGMTSVLSREIYGPLTHKQKEYLDIIHHSGHYLLSLVNEIVELGTLNEGNHSLNLASVDIEMLCQQALSPLEQAAKRRDQKIDLTVEPGHRIWLLDKDKVRQMLYHLIFSVIQSANAESVVRVHVSRKDKGLNIAVWVSHPWLGDGLPHAELYSHNLMTVPQGHQAPVAALKADNSNGHSLGTSEASKDSTSEPSGNNFSRSHLGLLLSRYLAEMHGGQILVQGSAEAGYRYVVSLPQQTELEANILGA